MVTKMFCDLCGVELNHTKAQMSIACHNIDACKVCQDKVKKLIEVNTKYSFGK